MKVSIVIPVYNGGDLLLDVLDQIFSQVTDFDYEVVIVDSSSSDDALDCAIEKYPADRFKVEVIEKKDFQHGATRNLGVALSSGEFVVFLTQDAKPYNNNWLANIIKPFLQNEKVAGVFGRHYPYADCMPLTARDINGHFDGFLQHDACVYLDDEERYKTDRGYKQFLHFFSSNNSALRKSVWDEIPLPNVDYGEDQTWALRIIEAGYVKCYANDSAVYHSHNYTFREAVERYAIDRKFWIDEFGYSDLDTIGKCWHELKARYRNDIAWWKENISKPGLGQKYEIFMHALGFVVGNYLGARK